MSWPDWILLAFMVISMLTGFLRGFIKEVLSLAVWVAAFFAAFYFSGTLAVQMETFIELPSARSVLAFGGVFLLVLMAGGLLLYLVGLLIEKTGLSGTDRLLGGMFGAVRGLILVLVLILLAGFTPVPKDPWWQESRVIASLLPLAEWTATFLPEQVRDLLQFDAGSLLEPEVST